jgi:hypothetical protein
VRSVTLQQRDSLQVAVELVRPGETIRLDRAEFRSLDASLVAISPAGVVRSVGPRGATFVTAARDDLADTIAVRVVPVAARIQFTPTQPVVRQDATIAFSAVVIDRIGAVIEDLTPTLRVLTPSVISLSNGIISVVGGGPTAAIEAYSGNAWDTATVQIIQVPTTLNWYPKALAVRQSEAEFLFAQAFDVFGGLIAPGSIAVASLDPAIAGIPAVPGDVAGISPGQTAIVLSLGALTGYVPVTVIAASVDPAIRIRLPTPGPAASVAAAAPAGPEGFSGIYVAVSGADQILWMEWAHWGFVDTLRLGSEPRCLISRGDGALYAALAGPSALARIDTATNAETGRVSLNGDPIGVALAPDGSRAFVLVEGGVLTVVNTQSMAVVDSLSVPGAADVQAHPDLSRLFLAAPDSGVVWVVRTDSLSLIDRWPVGGSPRSVAIAPARDELYVANADGTLDILTLSTGVPLTPVNVGEALATVGVQGGGTIFAVATGGTVYRISPNTAAVLGTVITGGTPGQVRTVADGSILLVVNSGGWLDFLGFGAP